MRRASTRRKSERRACVMTCTENCVKKRLSRAVADRRATVDGDSRLERRPARGGRDVRPREVVAYAPSRSDSLSRDVFEHEAADEKSRRRKQHSHRTGGPRDKDGQRRLEGGADGGSGGRQPVDEVSRRPGGWGASGGSRRGVGGRTVGAGRRPDGEKLRPTGSCLRSGVSTNEEARPTRIRLESRRLWMAAAAGDRKAGRLGEESTGENKGRR